MDKSTSVQFIEHMIALLELDIIGAKYQAENGLELVKTMLPLLKEELSNYRHKLNLIKVNNG